VIRPSNPWNEQEVIWRDLIDVDIHPYRAFYDVIADKQRTHLVREIQVNASFLPNSKPQTRTEAEDVIEIGNYHFQLLGICGIEVIPIEWHITENTTGHQIILARVPVIDGSHPEEDGEGTEHLPQESIDQLNDCWDEYFELCSSNQPKLSDIDGPQQYVYGNYRFPHSGRSIYEQAILVDPDLIFNTRY
jgi:hypothetical protein